MLMKRKKGFTLIELLAVIIILAIIMAIVTPIILKSINTAKKEAFKNSVYGIIKAAEFNYANQLLKTNNIEEIKYKYNNGMEISPPNSNKLEYKGTLPQNGTVIINKKGAIALAFHDGKYCIEKDYESDDLIITEKGLDNCQLDIIIYYTDASGANSPRLLKGMEPVVWSKEEGDVDYADGEWIEPSNIDDPDTQDWFDYGNKKWANAKTVDGSYWVWIPRYAYSITSGYHTNIAGTIDIVFLEETSDEPRIELEEFLLEPSPTYDDNDEVQTNYVVHPAFNFSNDPINSPNQIEGFWVAKFEASEENNQIKSLPFKTSLVSRTVSEFFDLGLGMIGYICGEQCDDGTDTHMIKNTEWGAVAYLSRSQYGNPNEIWKNAYSLSSKYMTGCSGSSVNASSSSTCVEWYTENGQRASTTGNVYGVYDMKGGAWEYVAAYVNNGHGNLTTYGNNIVSADLKYKDVYSQGESDTAQKNYEAAKDIYGDAIWETSLSGTGSTSWHGAYSSFIYSNRPWFGRGGRSAGADSGVFSFNSTGGGSDSSNSFRPVALR